MFRLQSSAYTLDCKSYMKNFGLTPQVNVFCIRVSVGKMKRHRENIVELPSVVGELIHKAGGRICVYV